MSRIGWGLFGALVVLAIGAFVPSAVFAHGYRVEGSEIATAETIEVVGLFDKIEVSIAGAKVAFTCRENASVGKLETAGKSLDKLNFLDCALDEVTSKGVESLLTGCTVAEPIELKTKGELVGSKGPVEVDLKPETGTVFTTVEVTGSSCALKGKYEVSGSQVCSLPDGEANTEDHAFACDESGSKLEVGAKEEKKESAKMYANDAIVLATRKAWSAK